MELGRLERGESFLSMNAKDLCHRQSSFDCELRRFIVLLLLIGSTLWCLLEPIKVFKAILLLNGV